MFIEPIHPRFSETNAAGHIGAVVFPVWFDKGLDGIYRIFTPDLAPKDWALIIVKFEMECLAEVDHVHPARIETAVQRIGRSSFTVVQSLLQNGTLAVRASTTLVHFDYANKKPRPIEGAARSALEEHLLPEAG
jgi:acyl-CoA thioester hydrolase